MGLERYGQEVLSRRRLLAAGLGAGLGAGVAGLAPSALARGRALTRRLGNGLTVAVEGEPRAPRIGVAVAYGVGQRHDPIGYRQLAHLVEHLLFQGSAHVPEDGHFGILEAHGVTEQGGFTGGDRTIVYQELPKSALPVALWLEADRMAYMLHHADPAGIALQREVGRNEGRQRGPGEEQEIALDAAAWPWGL